MITVPIQLNEIEVSKLDYLVKVGKYKNRTQAIKAMLNEKINQEMVPFDWELPEINAKRQKVLEKLMQISDFSFEIVDSSPANQIISDDREE
jgi:Arc/MetJ-type ribon-helix-helix transcriptional regulator